MKTLSSRFISPFLLITAMCWGCASPFHPMDTDVMMGDGEIISVPKEIKQFPTLKSFYASISCAGLELRYESQVPSWEWNYDATEIDTIRGYDAQYLIGWRKCVLGEWSSEYRLIPGKTYYVANQVFVKYIPTPRTPYSLMAYVKQDYVGEDIGCSGGGIRGFIIGTSTNDLTPLITCTKYIGYDQELQPMAIELPHVASDSLIWPIILAK